MIEFRFMARPLSRDLYYLKYAFKLLNIQANIFKRFNFEKHLNYLHISNGSDMIWPGIGRLPGVVFLILLMLPGFYLFFV